MLKRKGKDNGGKKITIQLEEINQKVNGERRKIEEISTKDKTIQTKQRKIFLSTTGRRLHENIPTIRCKRNRTILDNQRNISKRLNG